MESQRQRYLQMERVTIDYAEDLMLYFVHEKCKDWLHGKWINIDSLQTKQKVLY